MLNVAQLVEIERAERLAREARMRKRKQPKPPTYYAVHSLVIAMRCGQLTRQLGGFNSKHKQQHYGLPFTVALLVSGIALFYFGWRCQ